MCVCTSYVTGVHACVFWGKKREDGGHVEINAYSNVDISPKHWSLCFQVMADPTEF